MERPILFSPVVSSLLPHEAANAGILTQSLSASYHLFSNLQENRMNIGDFYDLAYCNHFNPFA